MVKETIINTAIILLILMLLLLMMLMLLLLLLLLLLLMDPIKQPDAYILSLFFSLLAHIYLSLKVKLPLKVVLKEVPYR